MPNCIAEMEQVPPSFRIYKMHKGLLVDREEYITVDTPLSLTTQRCAHLENVSACLPLFLEPRHLRARDCCLNHTTVHNQYLVSGFKEMLVMGKWSFSRAKKELSAKSTWPYPNWPQTSDNTIRHHHLSRDSLCKSILLSYSSSLLTFWSCIHFLQEWVQYSIFLYFSAPTG